MITKEELRDCGFEPWFDESERIWSWDFDRIMYNIKEQTLYDSDEVYGKHIKLAKVDDIEKLKDLIWNYFKIDIDDGDR
jgi:hypothetical protein